MWCAERGMCVCMQKGWRSNLHRARGGRVLEIPPRTTPSPLHSSFSWLPPSRGVCACAPREAYLTITATLARAPRPRPFFCLWFPRARPAAVTVHAAHNTRGQSDNRYSPSDAQIGFCILCGLCAPVYPERQDARRHEVLFHHRPAALPCLAPHLSVADRWAGERALSHPRRVPVCACMCLCALCSAGLWRVSGGRVRSRNKKREMAHRPWPVLLAGRRAGHSLYGAAMAYRARVSRAGVQFLQLPLPCGFPHSASIAEGWPVCGVRCVVSCCALLHRR